MTTTDLTLGPVIARCDTCDGMVLSDTFREAVDWTLDHHHNAHPHELSCIRIDPLGRPLTRWQRLRTWASQHLTAYGQRLQAGNGRP
jgi:hypothetical protein